MLQSIRTEISNELKVFLSGNEEYNTAKLLKDELKVVLSGTEEYNIAKLLKDMYREFVKHQDGLRKRLLFEESKIAHRTKKEGSGPSSSSPSHAIMEI